MLLAKQYRLRDEGESIEVPVDACPPFTINLYSHEGTNCTKSSFIINEYKISFKIFVKMSLINYHINYQLALSTNRV